MKKMCSIGHSIGNLVIQCVCFISLFHGFVSVNLGGFYLAIKHFLLCHIQTYIAIKHFRISHYKNIAIKHFLVYCLCSYIAIKHFLLYSYIAIKHFLVYCFYSYIRIKHFLFYRYICTLQLSTFWLTITLIH